jgi:hypothetical protein
MAEALPDAPIEQFLRGELRVLALLYADICRIDYNKNAFSSYVR